jgi:hypothetical protein
MPGPATAANLTRERHHRVRPVYKVKTKLVSKIADTGQDAEEEEIAELQSGDPGNQGA